MTYLEALNSVNELRKVAFIPAPQAQPPQGQGQQDPNQPPPQDPNQGQAQPQDPSQGQPQQAQMQEVPGGTQAPPTDLSNTTVTLRLSELMDLVSDGQASSTKLKIQQMMAKHDFSMKQMQRQQQVKEQQAQQQAAQKAQQQGMGMEGGVTGMQGGMYGQQMPPQ